MQGWCLHKDQAENFRRKLKDGTIDPAKLIELTSDERRSFFKDIVGEENAQDVNALFESKLLLKNQQQGLINWARKTAGLTPRIRRNILSRIEKLDKVLSATEEKTFLKDLAAQKLGLGIDFDEAQKITELTKQVKDTKAAMDAGGDRLEYGRAQVELNNYVNDLKLDANKLTFADVKKNPVGMAMKGVVAAPGFTKSIQAAFDNSALFRQGWKTLWTNPIIWQKNARKSFSDIVRTIGGKPVHDELQADIVSRPNFDLYKKANLDIGNSEEAFPTSLPEKVPGLGRLYKASENAYTNFLHKTRADVFDKYIDIANKTGVDLNDVELKNIGRLVNSLTGRGYLGHAERALGAVNNIFFSPRNVKAQIDALIQPLTGGATMREVAEGSNQGSNFVRKQSAMNLAKTVAGMAAILAVAKFLKPDSVDDDPRSADFGKIKIGNTRFDVTGGMGSLLVLAGRLASGQSKSSLTGKVSDLSNPGYGGQSRLDVLESFLENKLSPIAGMARDYLKGKNFDNKKPTVAGEGIGLLTPLPVKNLVELLQDPIAQKDPRFVAFAEGMDMLGISVNTYRKEKVGKGEPDIDFQKLVNQTQDLLK